MGGLTGVVWYGLGQTVITILLGGYNFYFVGEETELKRSHNLSYATLFITSKDGKVGMIPKRTVEVT